MNCIDYINRMIHKSLDALMQHMWEAKIYSTGAVYKSLGIYLITEENPKKTSSRRPLMKAV